MRERLVSILICVVVVVSGCARKSSDSAKPVRTVVDGPLSVTLEQVGLSRCYGTDTDEALQLDVWLLLERTDGLPIDNQNNVTLGGLSLVGPDGQHVPPYLATETAYMSNNVPMQFNSGRNKRLNLAENQWLLYYRFLSSTDDFPKTPTLTFDLRLGLTNEDEDLRPFVFKNVRLR